jgi:hypothetical protein
MVPAPPSADEVSMSERVTYWRDPNDTFRRLTDRDYLDRIEFQSDLFQFLAEKNDVGLAYNIGMSQERWQTARLAKLKHHADPALFCFGERPPPYPPPCPECESRATTCCDNTNAIQCYGCGLEFAPTLVRKT